MENLVPELLEVEYSFKDRGHNSLKFVDGRLFFFSEAHSQLSEKNEYLTKVSVPERDDWILFWKTLNQTGVWAWEDDYRPEPGVTMDCDVWDVKIKRENKFIQTRAWCVEPENKNEFFTALKNLAKIDVTLPFVYLSQKISEI